MEIAILLLAIATLFIVKTVKVVPQQNAWVVERLGKYHASLTPGLNFVVPFIDKVIQKHSLKEIPLDVPSQVCITRDNTQLQVDGILYFQVTDPKLASYGSSNYIIAVTQLAQTSLRSVIGKLELDKTFEERDIINAQVVAAIDASESPIEASLVFVVSRAKFSEGALAIGSNNRVEIGSRSGASDLGEKLSHTFMASKVRAK